MRRLRQSLDTMVQRVLPLESLRLRTVLLVLICRPIMLTSSRLFSLSCPLHYNLPVHLFLLFSYAPFFFGVTLTRMTLTWRTSTHRHPQPPQEKYRHPSRGVLLPSRFFFCFVRHPERTAIICQRLRRVLILLCHPLRFLSGPVVSTLPFPVLSSIAQAADFRCHAHPGTQAGAHSSI